MLLSLPRSTLLPALLQARTVARETTQAVTKCVLLRATSDALHLSATDMVMAVFFSVPCTSPAAGAICLPLDALIDDVRCLPDGDVSIAIDDTLRATIKSGKRKFVLAGRPAEEFPSALKAGEPRCSVALPSTTLQTLLARTHYAICKDDSRGPFANLKVWWGDGEIAAVALDGYCLASAREPHGCGSPGALLIPRRACEALTRILAETTGDVTLSTSERAVCFEADTLRFYSLLTAQVAEYPHHTVMFPPEPTLISVKRDEITASLRGTVVITESRGADGKARDPDALLEAGDGRLTIASKDPAGAQTEDEIAIDYIGPAMRNRARAKYMLGVIGGAGGDDVKLGFSGEKLPLVIRGERFDGVVMPMEV